MQNGSKKGQQHNSLRRVSKRLAAPARKKAAAALVFMLCFIMAFSIPADAAEKGFSHHEDTLDYCMRASNVTVGLTELQGLDESQKQELVERTSGYAFYRWDVEFVVWGDSVSASGDFSGVDWNHAGVYRITVKLPSVTPHIISQISYTLKIVDDLPEDPEVPGDPDGPDGPGEPDPGPEPESPAMYSFTVRFLEEETGIPLKDDYVSEEMEEGSFFTVSEDSLLPPDGYEIVEIHGDTEGLMTSEMQITVICRKTETGPDDPEEPDDPENPDPEDPEPGKTDPGEDPGDQDDEKKEESPVKPGGGSGKGSGRPSGSGRGKNTGKPGSKTSAGRTAETPSAVREASGVAAENQSETPAEEVQVQEIMPAEEILSPAVEAEIPEEEVSEAETEGGSIAFAEPEGSDESALGGAVLPQTDLKKEKYPMWSLTLGAAEGGILAVLGAMIFSDLKVIMWFEEKKKR